MASAFEDAARDLLGSARPGAPGVLHAAAVYCDKRAGDRMLHVLKVNAHAPQSPTDAFALALARARADAILTTGRNLRDEPVSGRSPPADSLLERDDALRAWRLDVLGRALPPRVYVLTRDPGLDLAHPLFRAPEAACLLTAGPPPPALVKRAEHAGIEIVSREASDTRSWVSYLRTERGHETVLVEAGPSTARSLYAAPPRVDELMLSVCPEAAVDPGARGPAFLPETALTAAGLRRVHAIDRMEPSGRWSFQRYLRFEVSGA